MSRLRQLWLTLSYLSLAATRANRRSKRLSQPSISCHLYIPLPLASTHQRLFSSSLSKNTASSSIEVQLWYVARRIQRAKTDVGQFRPVTDDDIGLKVLREAPTEAAQVIEYVHSYYAWIA
jgi:hypothetical protein